MAQRMAIVQSGRYLVWSLTFKDVENCYQSQGNYFRNYLEPGSTAGGNNLGQFLKGYGLEYFGHTHQKDSLTWLIQFLLNPEEKLWQKYVFVHGLLHIDVRRFADPDMKEEWLAKLRETFPEEMANLLEINNEPCLFGLFEPKESKDEPALRLFALAQQAAVRPIEPTGLRLACCLSDGDEGRGKVSFDAVSFDAVWNGYLRLYKLYQFLPHVFFVTEQGLNSRAYEHLRLREEELVKTSIMAKFDYTESKMGSAKEAAEDDAWQEIFELTDPELHALLNQMAKSGWPVPEVGYELMNAQGEIIATAELGWPALKIAWLREDEIEYSAAFIQQGWQTFPLSQVLAFPESYIKINHEDTEAQSKMP